MWTMSRCASSQIEIHYLCFCVRATDHSGRLVFFFSLSIFSFSLCASVLILIMYQRIATLRQTDSEVFYKYTWKWCWKKAVCDIISFGGCKWDPTSFEDDVHEVFLSWLVLCCLKPKMNYSENVTNVSILLKLLLFFIFYYWYVIRVDLSVEYNFCCKIINFLNIISRMTYNMCYLVEIQKLYDVENFSNFSRVVCTNSNSF